MLSILLLLAAAFLLGVIGYFFADEATILQQQEVAGKPALAAAAMRRDDLVVAAGLREQDALRFNHRAKRANDAIFWLRLCRSLSWIASGACAVSAVALICIY